MKQVNVSVLLPVYNGGDTLAQAVESILNQTLANFELLIIDDASKDNSAGVIRQYASQDSRIKPVFHEVNQGLTATLNEGLKLAQSDYVARMDHDDESLPNRLQIQWDYLQANPDIVVAGSFVYHMGNQPEYDRLVELPIENSKIQEKLKQYNCLYHPSVMMRRIPILAIGGYRPEFKNAEDYDLWLRVSKVYQLANIPQPLLRYRFSLQGMTLSRKWEQLFYVYLAQSAHQTEPYSLDVASEKAKEMLEQTDKRYFLKQVAFGTVNELIFLRAWKEAWNLLWMFKDDIGFRTFTELLTYILKQALTPNFYKVWA
jgi:glycosyltransferase involved in cell wall biosynthesis